MRSLLRAMIVIFALLLVNAVIYPRQKSDPPINNSTSTVVPSVSISITSSTLPIHSSVPLAKAKMGFIEDDNTSKARALLSRDMIANIVPHAKGSFTFPEPYNTQAARITDASDCNGRDCVEYAGYSYWRNMNNSTGSNTLLMIVGLNKAHGGQGVTLFNYNKHTGRVRNLGPIFKDTPFEYKNAEGMYFSAAASSSIYFTEDTRIIRFNVITKQYEAIFDATSEYGEEKYLWQLNSSDDDRVYSATLRMRSTSEMLGCLVFRNDIHKTLYYPKKGDFDECQIDRSGHWLVIKEQLDEKNGEDNLIINIDTGEEKILLDEDGAAGHSDNGYGYMVAEDNWSPHPGAVKVWDFNKNPLQGKLVYQDTEWWKTGVSHVSHTNARPADFLAQYACDSRASAVNYARANEIICFRLDGSMKTVVVAPTMTSLDGAGSMYDDVYSKAPKGNLDPTGEYFFWTTNMNGSGRLDAFIVQIPKHLLQ